MLGTERPVSPDRPVAIEQPTDASLPPRALRICVIRHSYYPLDPRVKRDVEALRARGHTVEVICLRAEGQPRLERVGGVTLRRVPIRHRRGGWWLRLFEYAAFAVVAGLLVTLLCLRQRFDLIQVHTVPDVLVFAALIPRLLGVPVLLDLHEVMPEMFSTTFGVEEQHWTLRTIARCEQASIRFADFALTCTEDMRATFINRGASPGKIAVVMNSADESVFRPSGAQAHGQNGAFRLLHHGTMEPLYGIDTVIRAVAAARVFVPELRLSLYGDGTQRRDLIWLASDLGVDEVVWFSDGFVPIKELIAGIASCDAGVVATRRDAFRDLTHCNKMFDLISMRRPVICSRTRSVMSYFPEDCFAYFEPGDHEDLARAIQALYQHPERRETIVQRAAEVNEPYRWPHQRRRYLEIVEAVASARAV